MKKEDKSILSEIFGEEEKKYKQEIAEYNKRLNACKEVLRSKKKELRALSKMYDEAKTVEDRKRLQPKLSKVREEILNAQPQDIRSLADLVESILSDQQFCVIGNETVIRSEEEMFDKIQGLL